MGQGMALEWFEEHVDTTQRGGSRAEAVQAPKDMLTWAPSLVSQHSPQTQAIHHYLLKAENVVSGVSFASWRAVAIWAFGCWAYAQ